MDQGEKKRERPCFSGDKGNEEALDRSSHGEKERPCINLKLGDPKDRDQ